MNREDFSIWGVSFNMKNGGSKVILYNGHAKGFKGVIEFYTVTRLNITSFKSRDIKHGSDIRFNYDN